LKRIFLVLGVLVLAYGVAALLGRRDEDGSGGGALASMLEDVAPESLEAVVFQEPGASGGTRRLERAGAGAWTVDGSPADSAYVARLLDALDGATAGDVVSMNPANHARMGVDDASAIRMILERSGGADTVLLGGRGPVTGTVYARVPDADAVHVLEADLRAAATRTGDDWRSKRLATVDTAAVRRVGLASPDGSFVLAKDESGWSVDGQPADSAAVASLLGELAALDGTGVAADPGAPDARADRVLTVGSGAGTVLTLRLWEPDEEGGGSLTAVVEGPAALQPGTAFTFPRWKAGRLTPGRDEVVATGESESGP
jgi:hypothetical protein